MLRAVAPLLPVLSPPVQLPSEGRHLRAARDGLPAFPQSFADLRGLPSCVFLDVDQIDWQLPELPQYLEFKRQLSGEVKGIAQHDDQH